MLPFVNECTEQPCDTPQVNPGNELARGILDVTTPYSPWYPNDTNHVARAIDPRGGVGFASTGGAGSAFYWLPQNQPASQHPRWTIAVLYASTDAGVPYCERPDGNQICKIELSSGAVTMVLRDAAAGGLNILNSSALSPLDGALHTAAIVQRATNDHRIVFDGVEVASNTTDTSGAFNYVVPAVCSDPTDGSGVFTGGVFLVVTWNRALTTDELRRWHENPWQVLADFPPEMVAAVAAGTSYDVDATDAASAADSASATLVAEAAAIDAVAAADSATTQGAFSATATDAIGPADSATTQAVVAATASDAVVAVDSATAQITMEVAASDPVAASDAAATQAVFDAQASDAVATADSATTVLTGQAAAADAVVPTDSATTALVAEAAATDPVVATDSATADGAGDVSASDAVSAADAATTQAVVAAAASDAVAAADSAAAVVVAEVAATDPVTLSDSATIVGNVYDVSATDSIDLEDSADTQAVMGATAEDALVLADAAAAPGSFSVVAVDAVSAGDSATASGTSAGNEDVLEAIAALQALMEQRFAELKNEIRTPATFYAMDARDPGKGSSGSQTADERRRQRIAENNAQILAMVAAIVKGEKEPPK